MSPHSCRWPFSDHQHANACWWSLKTRIRSPRSPASQCVLRRILDVLTRAHEVSFWLSVLKHEGWPTVNPPWWKHYLCYDAGQAKFTVAEITHWSPAGSRFSALLRHVVIYNSNVHQSVLNELSACIHFSDTLDNHELCMISLAGSK